MGVVKICVFIFRFSKSVHRSLLVQGSGPHNHGHELRFHAYSRKGGISKRGLNIQICLCPKINVYAESSTGNPDATIHLLYQVLERINNKMVRSSEIIFASAEPERQV